MRKTKNKWRRKLHDKDCNGQPKGTGPCSCYWWRKLKWPASC